MPAEAPPATPLWFYILKEAETLTGGAHLGPVGGTIVGEVLLGLLDIDKLSFLNVAPSWTPVPPSRTADPKAFDLGDLVAFGAGERVVAV